MQTNFSKEQLADPHLSEAERILRRCVHCGLCTAVCSTYVVLGDERDSPRGRIYLIKDMLENDRPASGEVQHHVDRCLSCLSCMTTCPSGVDYMHLVDIARVHIKETGSRSFADRFVRRLLAMIVPYPDRFRLALKTAPMGRPFVGIMRRLKLDGLAAMVELAPDKIPTAPKYEGPGTAETDMKRRARVILLAGCAQQVLRPDINDATIRLLARRGVDVVVANGAGCCGALVHHMGREAEALNQARQNVDAWTREIEREPVDAVIINASGCGTTVKDYAYMLRNDPDYAEKAKKIVALAKDITEFIVDYDLGPPKRYSSLRVAYHSACSMQHGQGITEEPKELLSKAGYTVADVPEGHICCGSAGVYNILQSEIATTLRDRKVGNIRKAKPDLVATGNIGCISHLQKGMDTPIAHTVELLDWAYGGPVPRGLEKLKSFVSDVPQAERYVSDDFLYETDVEQKPG
ncbi:MAG: glycolate oxidase subunit GlcF [Alphaproteobacteria bacterium]|nr:glycolate oxidase subunit GlcF [Alphaproteobacteria bacterium]